MKKVNIYLFIFLVTTIIFFTFHIGYGEYDADYNAHIESTYGFPLAWFETGPNSIEYYVDIVAFIIDFAICYMCVGFCILALPLKNKEIHIKRWVKLMLIIVSGIYLLGFCILLFIAQKIGIISEWNLPDVYTRFFHIFPIF